MAGADDYSAGDDFGFVPKGWVKDDPRNVDLLYSGTTSPYSVMCVMPTDWDSMEIEEMATLAQQQHDGALTGAAETWGSIADLLEDLRTGLGDAGTRMKTGWDPSANAAAANFFGHVGAGSWSLADWVSYARSNQSTLEDMASEVAAAKQQMKAIHHSYVSDWNAKVAEADSVVDPEVAAVSAIYSMPGGVWAMGIAQESERSELLSQAASIKERYRQQAAQVMSSLANRFEANTSMLGEGRMYQGPTDAVSPAGALGTSTGSGSGSSGSSGSGAAASSAAGSAAQQSRRTREALDRAGKNLKRTLNRTSTGATTSDSSGTDSTRTTSALADPSADGQSPQGQGSTTTDLTSSRVTTATATGDAGSGQTVSNGLTSASADAAVATGLGLPSTTRQLLTADPAIGAGGGSATAVPSGGTAGTANGIPISGGSAAAVPRVPIGGLPTTQNTLPGNGSGRNRLLGRLGSGPDGPGSTAVPPGRSLGSRGPGRSGTEPGESGTARSIPGGRGSGRDDSDEEAARADYRERSEEYLADLPVGPPSLTRPVRPAAHGGRPPGTGLAGRLGRSSGHRPEEELGGRRTRALAFDDELMAPLHRPPDLTGRRAFDGPDVEAVELVGLGDQLRGGQAAPAVSDPGGRPAGVATGGEDEPLGEYWEVDVPERLSSPQEQETSTARGRTLGPGS